MPKPWLLLKTPTGELRFTDRKQLDQHLLNYANFYGSMLNSSPNRQWARRAPEVHFSNALEQAAATANWLRQHHTIESPPDNFSNELLKRFSRLPDHESQDAHHFQTVFRRGGLSAASGAAALYNGEGLSEAVQQPETLRGIIEYILLKNNVDAESARAVETEVQNIREKYSQKLDADGTQFEMLLGELEKTNQEAETQKENLAAWWISREEALRTATNEKLDAALKEFQTTEDTFKERMKLDRPRKYWTDKARGHEKWSLINGAIAMVWLALAGTLSVSGIWWLFQKAVELTIDSELPATALATLGAMGLAGTTVAFWIARLLVRLWLSQMHLGMDARERVTMIESYLALTAEGAVDDKHREIVLSSIFRPTQDGIVKDDASADPTLAGLIARVAPR